MNIDSNGVWKRNITWFRKGVGRTDIQRNTLHSDKFKIAEYKMPNGDVVRISATDLREALRLAPTRNEGKTVGPYNINLNKNTVFDKPVKILSKSDNKLNLELNRREDELIDDGIFDPYNTADARDQIYGAIVVRRGQSKFRNLLLDAYNGQCAITGSKCVEVLESAHIVPYKGEHTNVVQNGILLRSDIHTLFDLDLLKIDSSYIISVDDSVSDNLYRQYHDQQIILPQNKELYPSKDALKFRA